MSTSHLAAEVEAYLFAEVGWVSAAQICARFSVNERSLRSVGDRPGLCTEFAISGENGYRHVARATDAEFQRAIARMGAHGLGELVHARRLRQRRSAALTALARPPLIFERATGQVLLLPPA